MWESEQELATTGTAVRRDTAGYGGSRRAGRWLTTLPAIIIDGELTESVLPLAVVLNMYTHVVEVLLQY